MSTYASQTTVDAGKTRANATGRVSPFLQIEN